MCCLWLQRIPRITPRAGRFTPLKDRIGSEIRTHYPATIAEGMSITSQESWTEREGTRRVEIPQYIREVVEEDCVSGAVTISAWIGARVVSQRLPISSLENVLSSAEQRAVRTRDAERGGESVSVRCVCGDPGDDREVRARI